MSHVWRVALIAAAIVALPACGGSDAGTDATAPPAGDAASPKEYVALLKRHYTPVHDRFIETIEPCLERQWKTCDEAAAPVHQAAQTFLQEMEGVTPPDEVKTEDAQLRKGVSALEDAIAAQHEAIAAKDGEAFDESVDTVTVAIADTDSAVHGINATYPSAELPTVH